MKTWIWRLVGLSVSLLAITLMHTTVSAGECDFWSFGGICEEVIGFSGQNTYREVGYSQVVDHYEEQWGSFANIMARGYWQPKEGERGVKWNLDYQVTSGNIIWLDGKRYGVVDNLVSSAACEWAGGKVQGFVMTFRNGRWVDQIINQQITISDAQTCDLHGGQWNDFDKDGNHECMSLVDGAWELVFYYIHIQEIVGLSSEACAYYKQGGARWFDSWDEFQLIPFEDIIIEPWEKIEVITHFWGASLQIPYPCASVTRSPYPRALTGEEAYFTVEPVIVSAVSEPIATCTPDIRQYQVHIRLVPDQDFQPIWYWDERNFSPEPSISEGWSVAHTWQTASYSLDGACSDLSCDKPLWGPSLSGEWLPAYKVNVTVAYDLQVKRTWIDWYGQAQGTVWETVDLREYGYNTSNLVLTGARDVTAPPAGAMAPYPLDLCLVPVPVIEAQSLLSGN